MPISTEDVAKLAEAFAKASGHPDPKQFAEAVAKNHGAGAKPAKSKAKAKR